MAKTNAHRTDAERSAEADGILAAELALARRGPAPRVVTSTEAEQIDYAEKLAGLRDAERVANAGNGGGGLKRVTGPSTGC